MGETPNPKANHLINEKSPYLQQHAYNPVDWYPWGEEAFKKARTENKAIFLSIGYSTCHWCHVMEHESFEDTEVAELMNSAFVSIKVDREERPDIDHIYMNVCQMLTGSGGWPLTIIMTPDRKPFFAGTYFPKTSSQGRVGMLELVPKVKDIWDTERSKIYSSAEQITAELQKPLVIATSTGLDKGSVKKAYHELASRFDETHGGFGTRPKFPTPHNLLFLLRYYYEHKTDDALQMVLKTLKGMRNGGLYDHVGCGFHRYSTDPEWLLPHFEKMLYDQAMLLRAYTEAFQITKDTFFKNTADEIIEYTLRELTSESGAFFSAEDADSEGEEGKFYVWTVDEFREAAIGDSELLTEYFNLSEGGNFRDEATAEYTGSNILHVKKSINELAEKYNSSPEDISQRIEAVRKKLFEKRSKRVRPHLDDKILTDWNGLMISSLAYAGRVLGNEKYVAYAEKAAGDILEKMYKNGQLFHRYRDSEAGIEGMLDDYSFMSWAMTELYEATFKTEYLKKAIYFQNNLDQYFWDDINYGFFANSATDNKLIARMKDIFDSAIPTGNSVALMNLHNLWKITGDRSFAEKASKMVKSFSAKVNETPSAFTHFLSAYLINSDTAPEIVIAGKKDDEVTKEMIDLVNTSYLPNSVLVLKTPDNNISEIVHYSANMIDNDGKTSAYVCRNFSCQQPVEDVSSLRNLLGVE